MKRLIILPLVLIFCGQLFAQNKFSGGLFFAPGISWMAPQNKKEAESTGVGFSYKVGAELDINLVENFAFCMALQYAKYGGKLQFNDTIAQFKTKDETFSNILPKSQIKYNINYLEIPLSFKGKQKVNYMTYFLKAGGQLGIGLMSQKSDMKWTLDTAGTSNPLTETEVTEAIMDKQIGIFNLGYHLGGGIEYAIADNTRILVEFLYNGGFYNINKTEIYIKGKKDNPFVKLGNVELKLGIMF